MVGTEPGGLVYGSMDGMKELTLECDKSQVAGISFGGQMHGLVTLDQADEVIRRPSSGMTDGPRRRQIT